MRDDAGLPEAPVFGVVGLHRGRLAVDAVPRLLELRLDVGDHLIGGVERAESAPRFDVGQAFGEPPVNNTALLGRVLVVRSRKFGIDADDAPETLNAIFWPLLRPA